MGILDVVNKDLIRNVRLSAWSEEAKAEVHTDDTQSYLLIDP